MIAITVIAASAGLAWNFGNFYTKTAAPPVELPEGDVCLDAPAIAYDLDTGLPITAPRPVPTQARCPVCGMYPARSLEWAAQVIYADGYAHFFDAPLSLFMFLAQVERYSPGRTAQDIAAIYVSDSAQPQPGHWVDARTAWYVHGSNALGPMRAGNLPAFASAEAASSFAQRRGGVVLAFDAVDASTLQSLGNPSVHEHAEHY